MDQTTHKICSRCKKSKLKTEFQKRPERKCGIVSRCKQCIRDIHAYKMANDPEYRHNRNKARIKHRATEKCKNTAKKYNQSEKAKEAQRQYEKSDKCKIMRKKYRESEQGKVNTKNWRESYKGTEKQKLAQKKYDQSAKGKVRNARYSTSKKGKLNRKKIKTKRLSTPQGKLYNNISRNIYDRLKSRNLSKNGKSTLDFLPYTINELKQHLEKQFLPKMTWDNYGSEWHIDHIVPDSLWDYKSTDDYEFQKCWSLQNLRPMWAKDNLEKSNNLFWDEQNSDKKYTLPNIINWFCKYREASYVGRY